MRKYGTAVAVAAVLAIATPETSHAAAMTDDLRAEFDKAVAAVDQFWAANYSAAFGGTYTSPTVRPLIDRPIQTACGRMPVNNAAYCSGDDTVIFGADYLGMAGEVGVLMIYEVVGHEWGHAIQQRANLPFNELGADCFAGAALSGATKAGAIAIPDPDGPELAQITQPFADPRPATRDGDHGNTEQQVNAFRRGWHEGPKSCVGGRQDRPPVVVPEPPEPEVPPVVVPPVEVPDVAETPDVLTPVIEPGLANPVDDAQSGYVPDFGSLGGAS